MLFLFSITWGSVSAWWLPACAALGALYSWVLYGKTANLSRNIRYLLTALRFITISLVALLLLSPMIKRVSSRPQKPLVLVVQDNSASINLFKPKGFDAAKMVADMSALKKSLGDDYDVREFHFDASLKDSLTTTFNGKQTGLCDRSASRTWQIWPWFRPVLQRRSYCNQVR